MSLYVPALIIETSVFYCEVLGIECSAALEYRQHLTVSIFDRLVHPRDVHLRFSFLHDSFFPTKTAMNTRNFLWPANGQALANYWRPFIKQQNSRWESSLWFFGSFISQNVLFKEKKFYPPFSEIC